MTSKQVRKAYKAATRTPSLSRAGRIVHERAEQERIRRELARDAAAARARAARERRRQKDGVVGEPTTKKHGGPPPVRPPPSQDSIARFARPSGLLAAGPAPGAQHLHSLADSLVAPAAALSSLSPALAGRSATLLSQHVASDLGITCSAAVNSIRRRRDASPTGGPACVSHPPPLQHGSRPPTPTPTPAAREAPSHHRSKPLAMALAGPAQEPCARILAPLSNTQAILTNFDDFFPSPSQQERELREEDAVWPAGKQAFLDCGPAQASSPNLSCHAPSPEQAVGPQRSAKRSEQQTPTTKSPRRGGLADRAASLSALDKENLCPRPDASQETDYGGAWMDELASDLAI